MNKLAVVFSVLHYLNKWWEEPSKFVAYVAISIVLAIIISSFFPRTGSTIFIFLLTLALIPFIFHVATDVKNVKGLMKWWKHALILIIVTMILYSIYAFISPVSSLDQRFETQWEEVEGSGIDTHPYPLVNVFKKVVMNNFGVILKVVLLSFFFGTGGLFLFFYTTSSFSIFITTFLIAKKEIIFSSKGPIFLAFLGLMYLPHAFLEIVSYIVAGLASVKLLQGIKLKNIEKSLQDSLPLFFKLLLVSIILMLVAAVFEAFIDPWLAGLLSSKEFFFTVPGDPYNLIN